MGEVPSGDDGDDGDDDNDGPPTPPPRSDPPRQSLVCIFSLYFR